MVDGLNDLWHNMLWRDKIDVVTLGLILEFEHQVCNFQGVQLPALLLLGNVPVLTEDAPQVAKPEKDCARTHPPLARWGHI